MKFHAVHGSNLTIDENGSRASRTSSFCDAIAFSHKPLALNARISLLLGSNEDWTGALRIGVTTQDPANFTSKKLPRYVCPDLTSKPGFWARPLPESWASNGTKLTFYVNGKGLLHVFVNSDHKGAVLVGIPVKEPLWVVLDLYGTTVSVKFISNSGNAPAEVIARGPEAILAYQHALTSGSTSYYHTRIALIGPPDGKKSLLKKLLIQLSEDSDNECDKIDTESFCQTSDSSDGVPWIITKSKKSTEYSADDLIENDDTNQETDDQTPEDVPEVTYSEEEFFKAIAINIVREMILQRKRSKDDRKKTPNSKSAFKLQSSLNKIGSSKGKPEDPIAIKDCKNILISNEELPSDLPTRVVELVETMLKDSESKQFWEKKEKEKQYLENVLITYNIWNYSGYFKYLILHQLFLSPQTIYLFVFDLSQDLEAPVESADDYGLEFPPDYNLSYLSMLHLWLEMIYVSVAHPKRQIPENQINDIICTLFPPVLIVGVQQDSTTFDTLVEHQFNKIKESIQDKIYYHLVHPTFYYVGCPETVAVDSMISELRAKVQELSMQLPHVGTEIPLKWMLFEQAIERLIEREVYFADTDKLSEVARLENIETDEEFYSMIHFFHHQGKIWHMGSDMLLGKEEGCGIVILKPQWFINYIYQLMNTDTYKLLKEKSEPIDNQADEDVFTSNSFEELWPNSFHHSTILLDIMDNTDILCEVMPLEISDTAQSSNLRTFMIPWLSETKAVPNVPDFQGLVLILDFSNLLPVGFFTKLIVRLFRWSKRHNWKINLNQICNKDMIPVDFNHCIKLKKTVGHRIQVCLTQRKYVDSEKGFELSFPAPHVCLKVRHLLERETEHLRDVWYKRLSFSINIPCPCEKTCNQHQVSKCTNPQCVHLLSLDDCLTKKVIECDYRLLKTDFIQKFFNPSIGESPRYSSMRLSMDSISTPFLGNFFWSDHDIAGDEPHWLKHVGNALTSVNTGHDWIALAKRLGYSEREIRRFGDETYPSISLLNDWINSNGRTRFCIDMLITCLEQMGRKDVINCILVELGPELPSPPVFISYQWESQQSVLHIRKRIELAGYPCWMDVGHIVGGDALYGKIYEGINKAKVVLCFLTPRYVLSPLCTREMSLADILRKPIVPIMLESTPWPPPGALALILSSLVYIDLCGIGGHGGSGRQADWETRFQSIIDRLSHFISPSFSSQLTTISSSERLIPPSTTTAVIRNPEEFVDIPDQFDEREMNNPDVPLPEEDTLSDGISTQESNSPSVWDPTRRNRVSRTMAGATLFSVVQASKFRGCLIGALLGDCIGEPFEMDKPVSKRILNNYLINLMSGESKQILPYTDDTAMTLSVASSLVEKGQMDAKDMAKRFVEEFFSHPKRGYGANVLYVFRALRETNFEDIFLPAKLQFNGTGSYGNGAAMRISPIALFGNRKGEQFIKKAVDECARITHAHPNGINGALLQSLAVNAALELDSSQKLDPVRFISNLHEKMEDIETKDPKPYCESLKKIEEIYVRNQEDISSKEIAEYLGNDVSALRSVPTAIYSFLRGMKPLENYENSNPFVRTLYFAISVGGDTDTIASMAASIAGAYYGVEMIPDVLQRRCELIDEVIKLADKLFDLTQKK